MVARATTDETVALMASFEMAHREESTRQFMTAEREALAAMLVVCTNAAREVACMAAEEEAARVSAAALELAAWEEEARAAARAELAEEATAEEAAQEEMAWDRPAGMTTWPLTRV
jgi:hypothetical protein